MLFQKAVQHRSFLITSWFKCFSNNYQELQPVKNELLKSEKSKKSSQSKVSVNSEIVKYLKECGVEHLINKIPKSLFLQNVKPRTRLYLINPSAAKSLSAFISQELLQNTSHVIENNPGLGFLTKELLEVGVPSINLYETNESFISPSSPLGSMLKNYPEKLNHKKLDFINIWYILLLDKYNHDKFGKVYLDDVPHENWTSKSFAQIITFTPNRNCLNLMIHNFFNFTDLFEHGRPTFFMTIPYFVWEKFDTNETNKKNRVYSHYSVMIHLFFDMKVLGELSRKAFLPWPSSKLKSKGNNLLDEPMLVMKIEPKVSALNDIKKEELRAFWFFVKYGMRSKKNRVLMEFEKFVPGCGPRLIDEGIDTFTRFKELSPKRIFNLYKLYKSWPEYDETAFIPMTGIEAKESDKIEEDDDHTQEPKTLINECKPKLSTFIREAVEFSLNFPKCTLKITCVSVQRKILYRETLTGMLSTGYAYNKCLVVCKIPKLYAAGQYTHPYERGVFNFQFPSIRWKLNTEN